VKKLTSERLGREGLAAWEERKSNADPEVAADSKDEDDTLDESEETTKTEPEAVGAEPSVTDEEAQTQHGTNAENPRMKLSEARDTDEHLCF